MKRDVQFARAVDLPFARIRERLRDDAAGLFGSSGPPPIVTTLQARLGRRRVARAMIIEIVAFDEPNGAASGTQLAFRGDASRRPGLFPHLEGRIDAAPIAAARTALFLTATYKPPLGLLGGAVDALLLRRFAEESLSRLLDDVVARLDPGI